LIYNKDGTPYKTTGRISQFNPNSNELDLLNRWDQEAIVKGGSPIFYYEVFIQPQTIHPVYLEDRGKIFSPIPIQLWAMYEPIASENHVDQFGFDSPNDEVIFEFNYRYILDQIGHPPKIGSKIYTPHLGENWEIIDRKTAEFKKWSVTRMKVRCRRFQESDTVQDGKVTKVPIPEIRIDQ
jgi:hypothetical protein